MSSQLRGAFSFFPHNGGGGGLSISLDKIDRYYPKEREELIEKRNLDSNGENEKEEQGNISPGFDYSFAFFRYAAERRLLR